MLKFFEMLPGKKTPEGSSQNNTHCSSWYDRAPLPTPQQPWQSQSNLWQAQRVDTQSPLVLHQWYSPVTRPPEDLWTLLCLWYGLPVKRPQWAFTVVPVLWIRCMGNTNQIFSRGQNKTKVYWQSLEKSENFGKRLSRTSKQYKRLGH